MAKLRAFFVSDLAKLQFSITSILAKSSEGHVESSDFSFLIHCLDCVSTVASNRDFSDLIRKK